MGQVAQCFILNFSLKSLFLYMYVDLYFFFFSKCPAVYILFISIVQLLMYCVFEAKR